MDLGIHIALANDTTTSLLQITGSPRTIEIVQGDQAILDIHTGTHLEGAAHQHTHLSGSHLAEQFLFPCIGIGIVDKGNLFRRHTRCDQLAANIVIDDELGFFFGSVHKALQSVNLRAVQVPGRCFCCGSGRGCAALGGGNIAEHKLGQLISFTILPDLQNISDAHIDLASGIVREVGIDDPLVKSQFPSIGCDLQHIVNRGVNGTVVDFCCPFRKLLDKHLLLLRGLRHFVVIDGLRARKVELVSRLYIGSFFPNGYQLREVEELGKPCSCTVAGSLRCQLDYRLGFAELGCPTVEVTPSFLLQRVVLEVSHHGVQFRHGVTDGSAGGKDHTPASGLFIQVPALEVHIGGLLCIRSRKASHIPHFRVEEKVLVAVGFIYEQPVNAQLFKGHNIIFPGS